MSRWFIRHRQEFIRKQLDMAGRVNRRDLIEAFDISLPQASADIAQYLRENPGSMVYDSTAKAYLAVKT